MRNLNGRAGLAVVVLGLMGFEWSATIVTNALATNETLRIVATLTKLKGPHITIW